MNSFSATRWGIALRVPSKTSPPVPALSELLHDKENEVHDAAQAAFEKIQER